MTPLLSVVCAALIFGLGFGLGGLLVALMSASANADLCRDCRLTHVAYFDAGESDALSAENGG